jgi:hypothetical protein
MNMSSKEQGGLKRIKKKEADGKIVILPTDKSGRFGVMSMATSIRAGMVHVGEDRRIGIEESQSEDLEWYSQHDVENIQSRKGLQT